MNTILIRAEDKNEWERRTPLVPEAVSELLRSNPVKIFVGKSNKRFFADSAYQNAGAALCTNMHPGDVIFGVKEIPEAKILPEKVYVFFSHTMKGQTHNMGMLRKIMAGQSTLIDYERITDARNQRLIFFGNFAGYAGAINILWLMGQYWRQKQIKTPFQQIKQALTYNNLAEIKSKLLKVGQQVKTNGLPTVLSPLVIGILGYGNVAAGVREILNCLPVKNIEPEQLDEIVRHPEKKENRIYVCIFKEQHLVRHKSGDSFDLHDYYEHPENYTSQFHRFLPYLTILINAIYWEERYPKFVTWENLKQAYETGSSFKLNGIADISCDVNGAIECNVKTTDSGQPAYLVHPVQKTITDGIHGEGIVLLAVDNLPAELAYDSSLFFSNQLIRFIPNFARSDFSKPLAESGLLPEIRKAVMVYRGELTPDYDYLKQYLS